MLVATRRRALVGEASWVAPAMLGVVGLAAILYLVNLTVSGYANTYYSAAALAGSQSWSAWFFGSIDSTPTSGPHVVVVERLGVEPARAAPPNPPSGRARRQLHQRLHVRLVLGGRQPASTSPSTRLAQQSPSGVTWCRRELADRRLNPTCGRRRSRPTSASVRFQRSTPFWQSAT